MYVFPSCPTIFNSDKIAVLAIDGFLFQLLARQFNEWEDFFLVDSMPQEVCKLSRSQRSTICKHEIDTAPDKAYCASMSMHYYGC